MRPDKRGYWNSRKEKLLKKFDGLSGKDFEFKVGEEKTMIEILSVKLGKSNQELLNLIINL